MKRTSIITIIIINIVLIVISGFFSKSDIFEKSSSSEDEFLVHHSSDFEAFELFLRKSEFSENNYVALNYDEHYGMWISYIDLAPMLKNSSEESFRNAIAQAFSNVKNLGVNTVYVHVRAFGDAYYPSLLYPYTDAFGSSEPFDALSIMIEEAHALELSFHAWLNPLRCQTDEKVSDIAQSYKLRDFYDSSYNDMIVSVENSPFMWLNPAYDEVREHVALGAAEIVSKYEVDGIHIDDYFYPTITESFDKSAFEASGSDDLTSWRLSNITKLVMRINMEIKKVNPTVEFDISPQGNINNNYTQMYADVESWCKSSAICDNIIPQVYFGYESSSPYLDTISKWSSMVGENDSVNLIIGLGAYKIAEESEYMNNSGILSNQISDAFNLQNIKGVSFYNYSIFYNNDDMNERMESEIESIKEIIKN